jgi:hypothetical protein
VGVFVGRGTAVSVGTAVGVSVEGTSVSVAVGGKLVAVEVFVGSRVAGNSVRDSVVEEQPRNKNPIRIINRKNNDLRNIINIQHS